MESTHVLAGLNPCNVFANAFGCRAREAARQAVGLVASARAATRFLWWIAAPRKATNI